MAKIVEAQVEDNRDFKERGLIQIRLAGSEGLYRVRVMSPIAGLPNMGMQFIPPIGATGFVLFADNDVDQNYGIWIGSIMGLWNKTFDPDNPDVTAGLVESEDQTDFVLKTQHTNFDARDPDSTENKVENIFKMNENELTLAKVSQGDQYEYKIDSYEFDDMYYQIIRIKDTGIEAKFKSIENDGDKAELKLEDGSTSIQTEYSGTKNSITIDESGVTIDSAEGKTSIIIDKDGKVKVVADKIELGGNANKAVLYEPLRDFVNQTFNGHTHGTPVGPTSPPVTPATSRFASKKVKLE